MIKRIFILLAGIFLLISCKVKEEKKLPGPQMKEIPVKAFKIKEPREISFEMLYPARTTSPGEVKVVARVSGILQKMFFKEGSPVKKGDLLFLIEKDYYLAQYEMARAQVEKAQAELNRAERDWQRVSLAVKDRLVSESEKDRVLSDLESAKARLKEAQANLLQAGLNLKYTEVRAEISGIIGKRQIDVGNLVTPGTILTTITQIHPLYVEFSIPERDLGLLGLDSNVKSLLHQKVTLLKSDNLPYSQPGRIDFVDTKLDETSSLKIRALFPNPRGELLPQTFVRIKIKGYPKKAILVPQRSVMQGPQGSYVYVIENGKVRPKVITLGLPYQDYYVLEKGLNPGELIVLDNLVKLRPDTPVKMEEIFEELK